MTKKDYEEILLHEFREKLNLPPMAIEWLMDVWDLAQTFDDLADGDNEDLEPEALDKAIWNGLIRMPSNSFYDQHKAWLIPAMAMMHLKWMAANIAERNGLADERSYVWRAGYYDLVCLVTALVHGPSSERSYAALTIYMESCADYLKEMRPDNA